MSTEIADAYVALYTKMPGVGKDIESVLGGSEVSSATEKAGKKQGGLFSGALAKAIMPAAIVAGIVAGFTGLYQVGSIFDNVSDTIRVGTGATGDALKDLEQVAKDVATSVPASFDAAGTAVADLNTRLGLSGDTLKTVASQYLEAGRILGEDVDIRSTSAAFSAFRIEGDAVAGAMDTLFQVSQATGVGMNELAAAVQANAPALQNLGFGFEDTVALVGSLDKAGVNANAVMGSMSRALVNLAKDGEEPQEAFRRVTGELQSFVDTGDIAAATDLAAQVFGTKGATDFIGALQAGTLNMEDLMAATGATGDTILGVAAETADFSESWTLLKNNAVAALEPLGSAVFSALGTAIGSLVPLVHEFGPQLSGLFDTMMSAAGPLMSALMPALQQLVPPLLQLWTSASPVMLIFEALQPLLPQLATILGTLAQTVGGILGTALTALAPILDAVATLIGSLFEAVLPLITPFLDLVSAVLPLLTPLLELVGVILPPLIELIGFLIGIAVQPLTAALGFLIPVVTGIVEALVNYLIPVIDTVTAVLGGLLDFVIGVFTGNWEQAWAGIQSIFIGIWNGIQDIAKNAINFIVDLINGIIGGINSLSTSLSEATGGAISFSIPKIPRLADGALIRATPGGRDVTVGEGRYDEAVLPLGGPRADEIAEAFASRVQVAGGSMSEDEMRTLADILGPVIARAIRNDRRQEGQ